jgi:hypothetical protein
VLIGGENQTLRVGVDVNALGPLDERSEVSSQKAT